MLPLKLSIISRILIPVLACVTTLGFAHAQTQDGVDDTNNGVFIDGVATPPPPRKIENGVAVFAGLDKITGEIYRFDVKVNDSKANQFGVLLIKPRVCYSRPSSETPQTTSFVEVRERTLDNKIRPLFSGWMFAASPGLNAVDHAIYDIWLVGCKPLDQYSAKIVQPKNDDLGGRGFDDDTAVNEKPATDLPPVPLANPLRG